MNESENSIQSFSTNSNILPLKIPCCQNQITCHFLHPISPAKPLLLAVPGGPGISGRYLNDFLIKLSQRVNINVGIMDLPNHDESLIASEKLPLSYQTCLDFVIKTIEEITQVGNKIILFAQSLGARLVFDALPSVSQRISGVVLTGLPYVFESSAFLLEKLSQLDLESIEINDDQEKTFNRNWCKILPLYTAGKLSLVDQHLLMSNTRWTGNEEILNAVPGIKASTGIIQSLNIPLAILQGDTDLVVPDNNFKKLRALVPQASFFEIANSGHFPMIEQPEAILSIIDNFISTHITVDS